MTMRSIRRWSRRVLGLGVCSVLALVIALFTAHSSRARLQPYYIVRGASFGQIHPRVLFVLDSSGSMAFRSDMTNQPCRWDECEAAIGTTGESRLSLARRSIRRLVEAAGDTASFALMTFDQVGPRTPAAGPPQACDPGTDQERRFTWVTGYDGGTIERYPQQAGAWRLCQGGTVQPYPYLRWDDLGLGSVISANDQTGAVPPSPLISIPDLSNPQNAHRRVQWFPQFMGVRARLDDTNDPTHSLTYLTTGDWGVTDAERDAEVRGHDFYYWPYVDGFPGYYYFQVTPVSTGMNRAGVNGEDLAVQSAQLYAPFYLDLSATSISPADRGPTNASEAHAEVLARTSPIDRGGVDAAGFTPWFSTIGDAGDPAPQSNAVGSHLSVASYLRFVSEVDTPDVCAPISTVLVTDGAPSPGEGDAPLYERLAALRTQLGAHVYVVGLFEGGDALNEMACAAAGACAGPGCGSPCTDAPAAQWDTCADSTHPETDCAFIANDADQLEQVLTRIVGDAIGVQMATGPGTTVNTFGVGAGGQAGQGQVVQTNFSAHTEFPGWRGHVVRSLCDDRDAAGDLLPHCVVPSPAFDRVEETFGPCPQSYEWDAGACLRDTLWNQRRLFSNTADHQLIPISEPDGRATAAFRAELANLGLLTSSDPEAEADRVVRFVLGADADAPGGDGWKLPGLANSSPVVVRRIPPYRTERVPEVALNDPHCAGRLYGDLEAGSLPISFRDFARGAWAPSAIIPAPSPHYESQEAVLVGDDMGVLHAFQLDSGNELWGFVPRDILANTVAQAANGSVRMGQPERVEDHIYGIAATINHAFAYDRSGATPRWRDVAIFGFGAGGQEYYALDVSHMSPESPRGVLEVLWTSEDPALKADYDRYNGQTWARPAISYGVPNDSLAFEPETFAIMGSGYPLAVGVGGAVGDGRTLMVANATTGEILDFAQLPAVTDPVFEPTFGALVDPAVGSHCLSRFWAEMQETYIADPAGRLFRWDLGQGSAHAADSGGTWGHAAQPVARFPACEGTGPECTVAAGNRGDVFIFPPAVSASNRIDDFTAIASGNILDERDQFLVALVSGSTDEDTIDGGVPTNPFHSSLYILVDDHQQGDQGQGFAIPAGAPKFGDAGVGAALGLDAHYLRVAVSDIERTRTVTPFAGASPIVETRTFSKATRPVRAPRIFVTGVVDRDATQPDVVIEGIEVYYVEFTLFEPATGVCDPRFYDPATGIWHFDQGSTYLARFRLTADVQSGFNFTTGTTSTAANFGASFQRGLVLESVQQLTTPACPDGNCGATPAATAGTQSRPCDNNPPASTGGQRGFAVHTQTAQLPGFAPVE